MNDFKKNSRFAGGGNRGGGFQKSGGRGFGGGRDQRGPAEMFQTVCASCQKACEVPFRPNGKKPVYCKDCFAANGGQSAGPRTSFDRPQPRRDFASTSSFKPAYAKPEYRAAPAPSNDAALSELKRSIETLGIKLDKLIGALSDKAPAAVVKIAKKKSVVVKKAAPKKKKK